MIPVRLSPFLVLASALAASAQTSEKVEQEFSADRPGFATSPGVLAGGLTQIEGGLTFSVDADGGVRMHTLTFGSPLIRMGVGHSLELRLAGDGYRSAHGKDSAGAHATVGWSDLAVGAKFALLNQGRIVPAVSLLPSISIPTGNRTFTSSTYDPSLAVAWLKSLPAGLSAGGTLATTSVSDSVSRRTRYSSALSLGMPAPARSAGFVELYGISSGAPGGASTWVSDAGLSRTLGASLQVDIEAGRRISRGVPCWFVAAGFALRQASLFRR